MRFADKFDKKKKSTNHTPKNNEQKHFFTKIKSTVPGQVLVCSVYNTLEM